MNLARCDLGVSQCFGWSDRNAQEIDGYPASVFDRTATGSEVTEEDFARDIDQKTFVVTGATGTLGKECARVLYRRGAKLVFCARDLEKANEFVRSLEKEFECHSSSSSSSSSSSDECDGEEDKKKIRTKPVTILKCDLAQILSVKRFCREFQKLALPLHGILCLAGVVMKPFELTEDGVESHFAINHLAHYAMVSFLADELTRTAAVTGKDGKIVLISSNAHHWSYRVRRGTTKPSRGIDFENLNSSHGYSAINSYGQSKLCPILHAWRISETINGVRAFAVNPGQFGEELSKQFGEFFGGSLVHSLVAPFTKVSVDIAAATVLYCLTNSGLPPGVYYSECKPTRSSLPSRDPRLATQLCEESDEMIRDILEKRQEDGILSSPKVPRSPGGIMMTSPAKVFASSSLESPRGAGGGGK